jgi:tetratricopeptide (TPR) repeat protein
MNVKLKKILLLLLLCVSTIAVADSMARKNQEEILLDYVSAESLYLEGRYEQSITALNEILKASPDYSRAKELIVEVEKKIDLTEGIINQGLDKYNKGNLLGALKHFETAHDKDTSNYKLRSLITKVLTELGMEYSFVGQHEKSLVYLNRAKELSIDDKEIEDLIKINKAISEADINENNSVSESMDTEKMEEMLVAFEEYQSKQDKILNEYQEAQSRMQDMLHSSTRERDRLYSLLLKERKTQEENISKQESRITFKNILWLSLVSVALLSFVFIVVGIFIGTNSDKKVRNIFHDRFIKSLNKIPDKESFDLAEYEKKIKKLDIIEKELAGGNPFENEIALNILDQFLHDADFRIRLRVVKVLHEIDAQTAVDILGNIITGDAGEHRKAACKLLGDFESLQSIDLLLKYTAAQDESIREDSISALNKIVESGKIYSKENWVIR